jgi:hypothetical protein
MSKYEDTRIVTFKEDYGVQKTDKNGVPIVIDGKPLMDIYYKKGSKHAIHFKVVEKLKTNGAKMEVEKFDRKAYIEREKAKVLERDKSSISMERR